MPVIYTSMTTIDLIYKVKTASLGDIIVHLKECNNNFHPPLAQRVNIEEYARKISEKAVTFEAWSATTLVGLIAVYFSNDSNRIAYVTNVSISTAFLRLGIASRLLTQCIEYSVKEGVREIKLEVHQNNRPAIDLYMKFDFESDGVDNSFLKMKLITQET